MPSRDCVNMENRCGIYCLLLSPMKCSCIHRDFCRCQRLCLRGSTLQLSALFMVAMFGAVYTCIYLWCSWCSNSSHIWIYLLWVAVYSILLLYTVKCSDTRPDNLCSLLNVTLGNQIKEDEMGRACNMHGRQDKTKHDFWWGKLKESDHLKDLGMDKMIILKWILKK